MRETDVTLPDGGTLHAYDTGATGDTELVVMWHHGTPNIGTPPAPLLAPSERLGPPRLRRLLAGSWQGRRISRQVRGRGR